MSAPRRVVLIAILLATAALGVGGAGLAAAAPLTGVDLSTYHRVGRYDLPSATSGNQLAAEASAVAYDADDDSLYVVGDEGTGVVRVSKTGVQLDTMALAPGAFEDTEGIAYLGGGEFALTEERLRQVDRFTYVAGGTLARADVESVKLGSTIGNVGLEGVSNDPTVTDGLLLAKEKDPRSVFATAVDWAAGTATNGSPSTEATDLFAPALAGLDDFSDVFALANLSTLTGPETANLLMISQESGKVVNVDRSGAVSSSLTIRRDADNALSVPDQTMEGVTMDEDGVLYVVNEGGGGAGHPQLWVYAPTATPNAAPTAVALAGATASLPENANTATRRKVANVDVTDNDGLGVNDLGVSGPDAASFEVDASGLYLKAGVALDYETKTSFSVAVTVDDVAVGATPDATSSTYTLNVTNVADEGGSGAGGKVVVSEVAPWGSSSAAYGADWWELTNTGDTTVDLTGWKVDDSSNDANAAVALTGVGSLAPGESAVFVEGDATKVEAFKTAWFGTAVPAGFKIGSYSGGGVGLSTSGDAVVIFNALGDRVTGVQFGAATTGVSFDNAAGDGDTGSPLPTIATLSAAGTAGAFAVAAIGETGSPGAIAWPSVVVSEVAPWGSDSAYAADWWEVTNTGRLTVDLSGWKVDDSSKDFNVAVALNGVTSLAPGASAVFVEGDATKAAAVKAAWAGPTVPAALAVGSYSGSGVGLSGGSGDQVNLYDPRGNRVTGVAFGAATPGVTFDNAAGAGSATGDPVPTITALSVAGGAGAAANGAGEIGSPGAVAWPVVVTEVSPTSSSGSVSSYGADWWEITNTGSVTVPLGGWKVDDSSAAYGSAVPLADVATLAPGASAVFVEGDAVKEAAFRTAWFGDAGATAVPVGSYTGSGVGLSASGDQVNVYDTAGKVVDGVTFGAATDGKSFDNAAGAATLTVLSARGVGGAFLAGGETGSPGTIAADAVAPVVTFSGAKAEYAYGEAIAITCAAADEARGSGVASTTCADVTGTAGVASGLGVGAHTVTATATDYAGNVGTASVTFTVLAAPPAVKDPDPAPPKPPTTTTPATPPSTNPPTFPIAPPKPKLTTPSSAKSASIAKGITTKLTNLTPRSRVTLVVKSGTRTITTIRTTATVTGTATIKLKLTAAQRAKYRGKKLTLRWTYTGVDGQLTKTTTLKVT